MNQNWELPAKNVDSFIYERIILNRELLKSWWDSQLDQEKEGERKVDIVIYKTPTYTDTQILIEKNRDAQQTRTNFFASCCCDCEWSS